MFAFGESDTDELQVSMHNLDGALMSCFRPTYFYFEHEYYIEFFFFLLAMGSWIGTSPFPILFFFNHII